MSKHKNLIADEWETYRREIVPADAPPVQIQETRRAFYAGVHAALAIMFEISEIDNETEQDDHAASLFDEIEEFVEAEYGGSGVSN